ncbi:MULTISPECIES: LuxR C-terminal-related transcriptional regulator [unclassified Streptomyces]|uniref:response regulator transcription factor n=1 Tax=unclassified Streptomyces TaxID=2593676 RepID=UPI00340CEA1C
MPYVKVVLLSGEGRMSAALASAHGARVFPKDERPAAMRLSKRELDVLQHLVLGLSNPEVAAVLNLSRHTVKQHTAAVCRKLGVRNRAQAASRAQELGLVG